MVCLFLCPMGCKDYLMTRKASVQNVINGCSSCAEGGNESRGRKMAQRKNIEPSLIVSAEGVNLIKGRQGCLIWW